MSAKILVVDDEPDLEGLILQKFRRQIRDGSISFLFAHDGVEALTMFDGNRDIDMVLSDINMPRMDGLEALPQICAAVPGVRVIVLSGFDAGPMATTVLEAGARRYLEKGRAISTLADVITEVLDEP